MNNFLAPTLRTVGFLGASIFLALLFPAPTKAQAPVVIDFEGIQPELVFSQFASRGVTFNGPLARDFSPTPGFAHSGTKAIELCFAQEFCSAPLNINFTTGQAHAKVWVGYTAQLTQPARVTMQALDANGQLVGQASVVLGPSAGPVNVQNPLEVNSPSANIRQIVVGFAAPSGETAFHNGLVIDDVEFGSAGPAPTCQATVPPTVSLDQPANTPQTPQVTVQTNEFLLQGEVQTTAPLDVARLTVTKTPSVPQITRTTDLLSTIVQRNGGNFGAIRMSGLLFPGTNRISIRMENCAGAGTDTAVVVFNPIAAGTGFKFLGLEVNQATQDLQNSVPLVGEKPTLVRVYLSVTGPTASIDGVSGALVAKRPGSTTPLVPLLRSINVIRVDSSTDIQAKRRDLTASLNFMLPPEWFRTGTLHMELSKLFINEAELNLPCAGCGNVDEIGAPRFSVFRRTKTLNLVLAPYEYTLAQKPTPDILFTPMGALQWLNNVYPLAGRFPSSGSGIRLLRILPTQPTSRDLHTNTGIGDFLDDLQDVMNDLLDQSGSNWPNDAKLFGMVPSGSGGAGRMPGNVAYGDTWAVENGLVPQPNYEVYGSIWAQEIAHNLGRKHVSTDHGEIPPSDPNFPFPHGGIAEPGAAIITGYWITQPPSLIDPGRAEECRGHAHDFMSYGSVNSVSGEHTRSWVSPFTYKALFKSFEDLSLASLVAPPQRVEKLVVAGRIDHQKGVTLRPFRRVITEFTTGPGKTGEYSVELVDSKGRTLLTYYFDEREDEGGKFHLHSFNEYVPWRNGTQVILIKRGKTVVARRSVSPHKPWVRVLSPRQGQTWGRKATITWEAGDKDKDSLTYTVLYNSGLDAVWLPIASGLTRPSATVDTSLLPGSARARIRVRASDGVNTADADSQGTFVVADKRPLVTIIGPTNGQVFAPGLSPQFAAAAYDPEDGMLFGTSLKWTSDRDGLVGHGLEPSLRILSSGEHFITVTATDSQGNSVRARVNVIVTRERPGSAVECLRPPLLSDKVP